MPRVAANDADDAFAAHYFAVLAKLFETEKDPISLIKWKEIYQDAETVLDICEDVAHIVQNILVKQA